MLEAGGDEGLLELDACDDFLFEDAEKCISSRIVDLDGDVGIISVNGFKFVEIEWPLCDLVVDCFEDFGEANISGDNEELAIV